MERAELDTASQDLGRERLRSVLGREDALLRDAFARASSTWPTFSLDFDPFAQALVRAAWQRLRRAGLPITDARLAEVMSRAAHADLYLAVACDRAVPGAWEALRDDLGPGLEAVMRRQGASESEAEDRVADVLGDLTHAPKGEGTRLRRYEASGKLFAWIASMVLRRGADSKRKRRPHSLDEAKAQGKLHHPAGEPSGLADPQDIVADSEAAELASEALRQAWKALSPREALTLSFKYRNRLRQKEVARLLGISETRVSRILSGAIAKIRDSIQASLPSLGELSVRVCTQLGTFLEEQMQDSAPSNDPGQE